MSILQIAKRAAEQVTGVARPTKKEVIDLVRARKAGGFRFRDDGLVPNHPFWPLVVYRGAVRLPKEFDPAAVMEALFRANGWGDTWRNGIYDYVHYHSRTHEVLGVSRGTAKVQFGGKKGKTLILKGGDVAVLPAGTWHQCLSASSDFLHIRLLELMTNARLPNSTRARSRRSLKVGRPRKDPVYGSKGPVLQNWKKA